MKKTKILLVGSLLLGTIIFSQGLSEAKKVSAAEGDTYKLVTDASTLSVGDEIIIASSDGKHVMGADKGNNRAAVSTSMNTEKVISYVAGFQEIKLEKGTTNSTFAFNVDNSYLCAASSGSNYLKTLDSFDSNGSWSISISNSIATIKSTGNYTRNTIKYNSNGLLFSCYSKGQQQISVLKKENNIAKHNVNYITYCDTKIGSKVFAEGAEITLPTEELIKDGYIFDCWYTDSEFKNKFVEGTKMGTQDITLYANWILDTSTKYTVRFMLNDGTENVYTSTIVRENETIEAPKTPTREGFKFTTWYTNIDLTEKFNFSTKITSDLTLYAGWKESTTITDKITVENLAATSTSYKSFTYTSSLTNIEYKGITSNNKGIQINGKNNYGIVVTKSNYKIKSITIEWNSSTTTDKELSIYASNKAYTNSSDLYDYVAPIRSFSKNETTYAFETDYNYVGVRSKSGVIVLNSISFEWELDKSKPTIDSTILATDYLCTNLMHDNNGNISITKAIRFIGSVNETKFADLQKVGFNFTLNNTTTKEYNTELSKLYHIIDDSDKAFDTKSDEIYVKDGYLNYSLILNNIPDDFTGTITYYAFATINEVNYQTEAKTINLVNGNESK